MKKLYQLKIYFSFKVFLTWVFLIVSSNQLFADGSKDLYPVGKAGHRAYLRSGTVADTERWPFPTQGTHYVYAKVGERITLASSAQSAASAASAIKLYSPSGTELINDVTSEGQIASRAKELAGPTLVGGEVLNKYKPIYYLVPAGGAGIYRVELLARGGGNPAVSFLANSNWIQADDAGILAWDISVINTTNTGFISGRVYTNVLNLTNGTQTPEDVGWNGLIYGLTDDGFTYKVNNNGNNGLWYTFFINNNGFIGAGGFPIYKSLNKTNLSATEVQNPKLADTSTQVTHKMFYDFPAVDLPVSSTGAVPGGSTWLKTIPVTPVATNLSVDGVEGTTGQVSSKGGYINFTTNRKSKYNIVIKSTPAIPFPARILTGFAVVGVNRILWDGKDGAGNPLPAGIDPVEVTIQLQGAEVHFPYIDMEYNKNGTIIELLENANLNNVVTDLVYWNDTDIPNATGANSGNNAPYGRYSDPKNNSQLAPTNSVGISSNSNGHKWGQGATTTGGQFGDMKAMDTWAFVKGPMVTTTADIISKISDLKITQLTGDKTLLVVGNILNLTIKVKNDGPSDVIGSKFTFVLPIGYDPGSIVFNSNGCGTETIPLSYNPTTRMYSSTLDLPNGCEISYTISVTVTAAVVSGSQNFVASILRPNDVTDPDATNPDPAVPPTNAQFECTNNGLGGACNNIRNLKIPAQVAFAGCTNTMYLTQYPEAGGTRLYTLNNLTSPLTITQIGSVSALTIKLNGIGYNPVDNFIYGINIGNNHLFRVDSSFNAVDLGTVANLGTGDFISGDIDDQGNYYVKANSTGLGGFSMYKINVNTLVATLITLNKQVKTADFAYNFYDKLLYGVGVDNEKLFTINPLTGVVNYSANVTTKGGTFGAMYTDGVTGAVYGNSNENGGKFFSFNIGTGKATLVSNSITAVGNDGAHCVTAPIIFGADLAVTKTDGKTQYTPGTTNIYTVVVQNLGPFTALNAIVSDVVPAGIPNANVTYTAVASTNSETSVVGTQTGAINDEVTVLSGGTITYTITLVVPATYRGDLLNIVTVTPSVNNVDPDLTNNKAEDLDTEGVCYNDPNTTDPAVPTNHGITVLNRAGANNGNWPMIRSSAFTVLESNTKGFVITRVATADLGLITTPQEGMMVYDTTEKCLKLYDGTAWSCFSTPACP